LSAKPILPSKVTLLHAKNYLKKHPLFKETFAGVPLIICTVAPMLNYLTWEELMKMIYCEGSAFIGTVDRIKAQQFSIKMQDQALLEIKKEYGPTSSELFYYVAMSPSGLSREDLKMIFPEKDNEGEKISNIIDALQSYSLIINDNNMLKPPSLAGRVLFDQKVNSEYKTAMSSHIASFYC